MADSTGSHSFNSALYVGSYVATNPTAVPPGGFGAFTEIAEVISMNGVPMTRPPTKLTHLKSDDRAHEKIPAILDGGQVTLKLNFSRARHAQLAGLITDPTAGNNNGRYKFLVYVPDSYMMVVKGFLSSFPTDIPDDDRITIDVTIEVSGKPVFVAF